MYDRTLPSATGGWCEAEEAEKSPRVINEGFFNSIHDLVELSKITELEDIEEPEYTKDGSIRRVGFTTLAGYSFSALIGMPKDQKTEIPSMYTTAWLTSTEGHNERTARNLMRLGNVVIMVGSEGSWHRRMKRVPEVGISLAGSAGAMLSFSNEISKDYKYVFDTEKRLLLGESRGAMVGMGVLALDKVFNQDVRFADLTAPCFPRRIEPSDVLSLASQLFHEPVSSLRMLSKLTLGRIVHYPSTVDANPQSFAHQVAIAPALLSGEAGDLATLIDKDKLIHITCFNNDKASMRKEWERIFAQNPDVHVVPLDGSHLSLVDPETLAYVLARNTAYRQAEERLGAGVSIRDIILPAHSKAQAYRTTLNL